MISSKPCPPEDCEKYYASDHTWPSGLVGDCWLFRGSKGLDTRLRGAWRAMPCQPMLPTTTSLQVHVEIKSHLDHFSSLIKIPMKFNTSIMHYDEKLIANVYLSYTSKDRLSPAIRNWKFTLNEATVAILRLDFCEQKSRSSVTFNLIFTSLCTPYLKGMFSLVKWCTFPLQRSKSI